MYGGNDRSQLGRKIRRESSGWGKRRVKKYSQGGF
jgi:hypothetical protein